MVCVVCPLLHEYVYGACPPTGLAVIVPVANPLQFTLICDSVIERTGGCVSVMVTLAVHPLASVTLYVYVPANTVKFPVPTNGAVPPVVDILINPVPPLQTTGEVMFAMAWKTAG